MKVSSVGWENYRRLPDGVIAVRDHLVLVGPNDTGKSSILRALHLCLGMSHSQLIRALGPRDFTDASQPLRVTVTLEGIQDVDRSAFPDEITTGDPETLVIAVEASADPTDSAAVNVRRFFPDGGHTRAPSRVQLETIGFHFVPAIRSLLRELSGRSGAVGSLLAELDLSNDAEALEAAALQYREALDNSTAISSFRNDLAGALSESLPAPVDRDAVRVVSEAEALDDPLSGVIVTVRDGDQDVPLAEQSDGIRAISVLTLLGMSHGAARIVAVDEPETHLHPSAQRATSRMLRSGGGQLVLATHSPAVVESMDPMDVVAFGADRSTRQLPSGAEIAGLEMAIRHWSSPLIEPLTARQVVVVEGISDKVLLAKVAELRGRRLERAGVVILELGGSGLFPLVHGVLGPSGFDLPLVGLLDEDARSAWASAVGVDPADLEDSGFVVCNPDLEAEYVTALGVNEVVRMLLESGARSESALLQGCGATGRSDITDQALIAYCGNRKHKVPVALAIATAITPDQAASIAALNTVLGLVS